VKEGNDEMKRGYRGRRSIETPLRGFPVRHGGLTADVVFADAPGTGRLLFAAVESTDVVLAYWISC
jgi:hypothetical protein